MTAALDALAVASGLAAAGAEVTTQQRHDALMRAGRDGEGRTPLHVVCH